MTASASHQHLIICLCWLWSLFLIGCQTAPTSSLNQPAEADELQVYLVAIQAESTLEAVQVRMTATAQTAGTTATAQVQQVQTTQTQQAWEVEITQTQQAWVAQSTDTAQVQQATASAESARQATQVHGTATQQAVIDELTFLKLERERITNRISAIVPWVLGIAAIAGLLLALTYWAKVEIDRRKAFRDSDGRVTQVLDINPKGTSFISTDRMAGEALHINPSGQMTSSIPDLGIRSQILMAVILAEALKMLKPSPTTANFLDEMRRMTARDTSTLESQNPIFDIQVIDAADQTISGWVKDVENNFASKHILLG